VNQTVAIETLRDLADLLSSKDASVSGLVDKLGTRPVDLRGNVVVQHPRLPGIRQASVVRQVGGGEAPALVTLELTAPVALVDLEAAFGEPTIVSPDHPGQRRTAVFFVEGPTDRDFLVRLIGALEKDAARSITLQRDVKLTR
jgi:hypothetical protein